MLEISSKSLETYLPAGANPFAQERTERVLVVDDEHFIRDVLTKVVSAEGFKSDTAQDAQEAMQKLAQAEYEMVLTDITMPGLDGLQLLQHVATHYPEIAVIMITGVSDVKSAVHALSSGAYDYVTKPFNVLELKSKLHKALDRRRLVFENRQYQLDLERRVEEQTAELRNALVGIRNAYSHTLEALINALDARERETQRHSKRVSEYTLLIAQQMSIPLAELVDVERGALLHDIGKIGISDNILLKPAKLTQDEWVEIRKHPEIGYQILKGIDFLEEAARMVLQHQERFDGTGYPQRLAGKEILLGARIFAVVDTFDAMTSDRPYRKALSYQTAREEIIRCSGTQFDPELVECFLNIPEQIWFKTKQSLVA
ncbi:MAG: response regulator [Acidobacteria bacterium]|nr:response regulator [Acidobacteriota bacterium]MCI0719022.1 response regulator [Acidobacteriota bacterium]